MAAGDRSQALVVSIRRFLNEPVEGSVLTADLYRYLTEAQMALAVDMDDAALGALYQQSLVSITLDQEPFALPANFLREQMVIWVNIPAIRWPVWHQWQPGFGASAPPSMACPYWYIWNGYYQVLAGLRAAGAVRLNYLQVPVDVTAAVDPTLGTEFDDLMVWMAGSRACESVGDFETAALLTELYDGAVAEWNGRYSGRPPVDTIPGDTGGR
jgi:hypothetical protein